LQYRLAEAGRRLLADVQRRITDSTERLTAALDRADRIRSEKGEQGDRQLAELAAREQALRAILGQLSAAGTRWSHRSSDTMSLPDEAPVGHPP
jgi:hypothetical protein